MALRRRSHPIVTLLTDFGSADAYVAAMKGTLLRSAPHATVVDITHEVPPQDLLAASMILADASAHFPEGTLHVVVVDPGVGTDRAILAAEFGSQRFLFPDNGVISHVADALPLQSMAAVDVPSKVRSPTISRTFHGRDVFAPLAGAMLSGTEVDQLGAMPDQYCLLDLPRVAREGNGLVGQILYVDRFGNCVTNIRREHLAGLHVDFRDLRVTCNGNGPYGLSSTYGAVEAGQVLALINSSERMELSVNRGRADRTLGCAVGDSVRVVVGSPS